MPSKMPGVSAAVRARLHAARIARLATLDAERSPHLVPVCFVYCGSVFYSAIDRKPKRVAPEKLARLEHIRSTPQVALLIDHYDEDWTLLWYILVRGKARLVPSSARAERAHQTTLTTLKAQRAPHHTRTQTDELSVIGSLLPSYHDGREVAVVRRDHAAVLRPGHPATG